MYTSRVLSVIRQRNVSRNLYRKLRFSSANFESTQPEVQEEKFDFEDLKVAERTERRKPKIEPFMKNVFVSIFDRELLAYPEILNKEESEALDQRIESLDKIFSDPERTMEDRKKGLIGTKMYAAPVNITNGGLASNVTESLRYMDVIASDLELGLEITDHWAGLNALSIGLTTNSYQQVIDELVTGDNPVILCIKEKVAERITQADFRTTAFLDSQNVWRVTGEKVCRNKKGFYLVLCMIEAERIKALLVHPNAEGVHHSGNHIKFANTPATLLDVATDQSLGRALFLSRLLTATVARRHLKRGLQTCLDYVHPRTFSGKPLSELSTIRATVGDALLTIYASESAEYFTAGLLDGYMDPDAELEMSMCRNFITTHGLQHLMQLMIPPSAENPELCDQIINDMRRIQSIGETLDSVNFFISLNGIYHAGKFLNDEVKQMRNPLFHPMYIIKKMISSRLQEKDDPKLTLQLCEHLHPSLRRPADSLEYCVLRMRFAVETIMARHGLEVANAFTELNRLAKASTEILAMSAVLARASRSYCIGLRNAQQEMKLASVFAVVSTKRVKELIKELDDGEYVNCDHFRVQFGCQVLDTNSTVVELPTARTYW